MMLSRAWTQAGIDTFKADARATRVLQFVRDEGQMTEEERALTQAGKELIDNTTHHIDDVETKTGTTIQWYDHLKGVDIDTNRKIGLTNMEYYTRLIDYAEKNGGYVPKVSQQRGSCLFHSVRKSITCPREFSNSHLRRMIICFIVDNFELLWPMLHFAIKGNYGHLRLTTDQFREKERLGTLTDREREEYFEPGPFIYGIAANPNVIATSLYCIATINHQFLLVLCLQYRNMMQKTVKGMLPECGMS